MYCRFWIEDESSSLYWCFRVLGVYSVLVKQAVTILSLFMQESNNSLHAGGSGLHSFNRSPEALEELVRLTLLGCEAAGVRQSLVMAPPPAGAGPVLRPRHPAAAHLQQDKYPDRGGILLRRITASFVNVGFTQKARSKSTHSTLNI